MYQDLSPLLKQKYLMKPETFDSQLPSCNNALSTILSFLLA